MIPSPRQLNLPHDEWRPGQYEAVQAIQNSNKKVVLVDAPTGSGKCIDVNTLVSTPDGLKAVKELNVGDKIVSVSPAGKSSVDVVSRVFPVETKETIEITTRYGYSIKCTRDHAVLVWNGAFSWKKAGQVNEGDVLCIIDDPYFSKRNPDLSLFKYIPRQGTNLDRLVTPILPKELNDDWAYFTGVLVGDGSCKARTSLRITTADTEIDESVYKFCEKIGVKPNKRYQKKKTNCWEINISSVVLREFLVFIGLGREKSIDKTIPWSIIHGTRDVVASFLRGLFDTDGSVHSRGFEYGTSSYKLAKQVHATLLKFGIRSMLKYREKTNSYRILVTGESLRILKNEIGFGLTRKQAVLDGLCKKPSNTNCEVIPYVHSLIRNLYVKFKEELESGGISAYKEVSKRGLSHNVLSAYYYENSNSFRNPSKTQLRRFLDVMHEVNSETLESIVSSNIFFDPIKGISESGTSKVMDISVLGYNNFVANGILVHNSAIGLALGSRGKSSRILTFTKALQAQYDMYPNTEALYGLNNYPCALLGNIFNADACAFSANMLECHVAGEGGCAYVNQRQITKASHRQALSYPYYFLSSWPHKSDAAVDYLYCDEAHHMPQAIMSHMTLEVKPDQLSKMGFEPIPQMPEPQVARRALVLAWLEYTIDRGQQEVDRLNLIKEKSPGLIMKIRYMTNLIQNSRVTYAAMEENGDDFFIDLMDDGSLRIFPLTPAPFFWTLFNVDDRTKIVPASATLGNHREFVKLLGIGSDWESHVVPPVYPASSQPIFYYDDAPRMGYKSGPSDYRKQVEIIASIINQFPNSADGLIHFVSIQTAKQFGHLLSSRYGDRLWMPDTRHSTEEKLASWELRKKTHPGTICLSWSFHTGVDSGSTSFNIVQKIPYMPLDTLGQKLLERNKRLYGWLAGITAEQACGRIRRGEPEHYEEPGQPLRKHVSIIDGNWTRVKSYFSDHFLSQMTKA